MLAQLHMQWGKGHNGGCKGADYDGRILMRIWWGWRLVRMKMDGCQRRKGA